VNVLGPRSGFKIDFVQNGFIIEEFGRYLPDGTFDLTSGDERTVRRTVHRPEELSIAMDRMKEAYVVTSG